MGLSKCPSKKTLKSLYNSGLTQSQIGEKYNVTYTTVLIWMRRLKIKSRGILHIVKNGSDNPQWKGNSAGYKALHHRVNKKRGRPMKCMVCGTSNKHTIYDWACVGKYTNITDYRRMCRSCHRRHDINLAKNN